MARNQEKTTRPEPVHDEKEEEQEDSSEEEGEEEEEEEEEGEDESGSGSEQAQPFLKSPALPPQKAASGESSSEDDESGSDTESEERTPQKPVKKEASKKTSATDQKTAGGKRLAEEKEPLEAKTAASKKAKKSEPTSTSQPDAKSQKKDPEPSADVKKQLFQRIWSEESEIVLLEGMIEFIKEKNADPYSQLDAFHAFIKQKLNIDATRTQLQSKIRNLKKKYQNSKKRASKNSTDEDEDPVFSKPHEHKSYELSKKIWGHGDTKKSLGDKSKAAMAVLSKKTPMKKENGSTAAVHDNEVDASHNVNSRGFPIPGVAGISSFTCLDLLEHEKILAIGSEIFEGEKAMEGTEEWQKLRLEGMKVHLKRLNIMSQQTKLVLDNWKSKNV